MSPFFLCTTDDVCPKHGRFIYFCQGCHDEVSDPIPAAALDRIDKAVSEAVAEKNGEAR